MWGWPGRLRQELPPVNYAEDTDSEEENFEDGLNFELASPRVPVHTREGSPQLLAHPTLADNVDEVLEEVTYHLHDHQQVEEEIDELTDLLQDTDTKVTQYKKPQEPTEAEEVIELNLKVSSDNNEVDADNTAEMPDNDAVVVNHDVEDKEDGEKAPDQARHIKLEFDSADIRFWFAQLEDEMVLASIGRQWLKKTVLQRNLPVKQKEDVKSLLTLQKAEAGDDIYFRLKTELIRIYAPKPQTSYRKALGRTMAGLPSQLGAQIIDDICKKPVKLVGCCCAGAALAIWSMKLPVNVLAHISNKEFTSATYKAVFEAADQVFLSSQQVQMVAALDETLPAFNQQNQPSEVAALAGNRNNRGGSGTRGGGNRGGRGNRGGQGRGQNRGGNRGNTRRGPRHSSSPPESCCDRHYVHGDQAWYCLAPHSCPWKDRCTPKP